MLHHPQLSTYETKLEWMIVPPSLFFLWSILEFFRIRLGYSGNLRGKVCASRGGDECVRPSPAREHESQTTFLTRQVPELSAFILITLFPQIPILAVLAIIQVPQLPVEMIISLPLILLLVSVTPLTAARC